MVVDVYRTDTVRTVEGWGGRGLVIRPGTDAALALGLVAGSPRRVAARVGRPLGGAPVRF